jgi:hypothetical protein
LSSFGLWATSSEGDGGWRRSWRSRLSWRLSELPEVPSGAAPARATAPDHCTRNMHPNGPRNFRGESQEWPGTSRVWECFEAAF